MAPTSLHALYVDAPDHQQVPTLLKISEARISLPPLLRGAVGAATEDQLDRALTIQHAIKHVGGKGSSIINLTSHAINPPMYSRAGTVGFDIAAGRWSPGYESVAACDRSIASATAVLLPYSQLRCWMIRSILQPPGVRSMWLV